MTERSAWKKAVQNLPFVNFEDNHVFTGLYRNTITLGEDNPFDVNIFADAKTGEEKFVTNSYSIEKAIKLAKKDYPEAMANVVFRIEFLGKTEVKGKPFNQFNIEYCTVEEYEAMNEGKPVAKSKK